MSLAFCVTPNVSWAPCLLCQHLCLPREAAGRGRKGREGARVSDIQGGLYPKVVRERVLHGGCGG